MTIQIFSNNAKTTLAAGITSTQTTITVASGKGALFPNPTTGQQFKVTLVNAGDPNIYEICNCTSRSGDVLTVIRAQEGTTGKPFLLNDVVGHFDTAGVMTDLVQSEQLQQGTYTFAVASGTANALTATLTSNLTVLSDGLAFVLESANTNTGAVTLTLTLGSTTLSTYPIVKAGNTDLVAGDIPLAGYPMQICWSATFSAFVLQNPAFNFSTSVTVSQLQSQTYTYAVATGGSDAVAVTYTSPLTSLTDGMLFTFKALYSNSTTTPTINVTLGTTATGAIQIVKGGGNAVAVGDINAGGIFIISYSSSLSKWILINPYGAALGTMASQNANAVAITGGSISGISPPLPVASGGTGVATITSNSVVLGNGTSAIQTVLPSNVGNVLTSNGTTWISSPSAAGGQGQSFTSSGTFTIPSGVTALKVTVVGGGGGGAGAYFPNAGQANSGLGGGGAGSAIKFFTGLTSGNTLTVTVGGGGIGDYYDSGGAHRIIGTSGGNSTVSSGTQSITTVTGGGGAVSSVGSGGQGGTSTNGTINLTGQNGGVTTGGSSNYGFGGQGQNLVSGGGNGNSATGYGGGGAGATVNTEGYAFQGGNGTGGIVIFEW